ncbi:MAG: glycosyl transferase family 2, partial [Hyphomicrobiales bacterium]|nr:glycosyl transferase family 2 [Hyphomicrobiales bacterium]
EAADVPGARRLHLPETLDGSIEEIDLAGFAKANILFGRSPALGYLKPLFRRDFLERANLRYDEELRIGEDFGLVAECLVRGARYVRSRSADYVYMTHDGSISHRLKLSDLQSMIDFDRRFLTAHPQLREQEDKAIRAHLQSLEVGEAFTIMVDHLKSRSISGFLSTALQRPSALHLLSMPIRARASRIAARLLAGRAGKGV